MEQAMRTALLGLVTSIIAAAAFDRGTCPMMVPPDIGPALGGGALIGVAAVLLLLANGKIAGISGIVAFLLGRPKPGLGWGIAFLVRLIVGLPLMASLIGHAPSIAVAATWPTLVIAGLAGAGCGGPFRPHSAPHRPSA